MIWFWSLQSPTITRLDPCFRMRFETTTSAQARTNRKQRNIGNLAKILAVRSGVSATGGSLSRHVARGKEQHSWMCTRLCKYHATATPSIVWFAPCPSRYSI
eukprot:g19698.t1